VEWIHSDDDRIQLWDLMNTIVYLPDVLTTGPADLLSTSEERYYSLKLKDRQVTCLTYYVFTKSKYCDQTIWSKPQFGKTANKNVLQYTVLCTTDCVMLNEKDHP
jgi:hypothetical protein